MPLRTGSFDQRMPRKLTEEGKYFAVEEYVATSECPDPFVAPLLLEDRRLGSDENFIVSCGG